MAAGDNPDRLHSEGAWAHLCGVAPVPAGIGQDQRQGQGPRRWRSSGQQRAVAHRHGPHRARPRDPALLRASSQGGQDQGRGHPHLEALRRPRALSIPASRLRSLSCWVWLSPVLSLLGADSPAIRRPSARANDLENAWPNRSLSSSRVTDQCRVRCFHSRAPKEGLTSDRSSPGRCDTSSDVRSI